MVRAVAAAELKRRLAQDGEIALIDLREEGAFSRRHLLLASCVPLSRLELMVDDLVPRRTTPLVLCDAGEGLAARGAARLAEFGYTDVAVLDGGVDGWARAGFEVFSGVNVPSKAFGELVEEGCGTPHLSASELKRRMDAGENLVVLDSRPIEEFRNMSIPTATDVPGAELVWRVRDVAPSPDTLVVVNCAGRTRSIIGAQSLINAGIPNRVMALKDGTMGWLLAGLTLDRGKSRSAAEPSAEARRAARAAADDVARRYGVRTIDAATLDAWRRDGSRTTYVFDVRTPEEFRDGHLAGAIHAPGGQLVQATDKYAAVRNARMVLVDDAEVRAVMTASWLLQMGWTDTYVLRDGIVGKPLVPGAHQPRVLGLAAAAETIDAQSLSRLVERGGATLVDLELSTAYARGHIPGAWFAIRARLPATLSKLAPAGRLVLTSADGALARLAAAELSRSGRPALALAGGTAAWAAAGLPLESGRTRMADEADDVWSSPYADPDKLEERMREYLAWEVNLVRQVARDGSLKFRIGPVAS